LTIVNDDLLKLDKDLNNNSRTEDGKPDAGAYEFNTSE